MDFSAKFQNRQIIVINQDLSTKVKDEISKYKLRCENPIVDILINATNREQIVVPVTYTGKYTITQFSRSPHNQTTCSVECEYSSNQVVNKPVPVPETLITTPKLKRIKKK